MMDAFAPLMPDEAAAADQPAATSKPTQFVPTVPMPGDHPLLPGLTMFKHKTLGQAAAVYLYRNAAGEPEGYVCRFNLVDADGNPVIDPDTGKQKKQFRPLRYGTKPGRGGKPWTSFHWNGWEDGRPLYRLPELLSDADKQVVVCEGERKADVVPTLFPDVVGVSPMNGAKSPSKTDWAPVNNRRLVIFPDRDKAGRSFAEEVARLAFAAGAASVHIVQVSDSFPEKWDIADSVPEGANLRAMLDAAAPWQAPSEAAPEPAANPERAPLFRNDQRGVYMRDDDGRYQKLCSPLNILAETRDVECKNHGRLVEVETPEGIRHRWAMPMSMLAGDGSEYRKELLRLGLCIEPGKWVHHGLHTYISIANPGKRARNVERTGWHGKYYVGVDQTYGDTGGEEVLLQVEGNAPEFTVNGTFEGWQNEVAALAVGNSRLVLAISTAFAGRCSIW